MVRALRSALPGEDIVYLGDTARVPYGSKSPRTVERYSLGCQGFLLARDVKLVLIACNTASATSLPALTAASEVPVIGAVDPGADSAVAATLDGHIGVIGTVATVASGAYERAIAARRPDAKVSALACPLFVPLAEEGWVDDEIAALTAQRYLGELFRRDSSIDTLVLGCTHYPLLAGVIGRVAAQITGREIAVVDSANAMAVAARATLLDGGLLVPEETRRGSPGRLDCYATDPSRMGDLAPRFLGEALSHFDLVDL